MEGNDPHTGHGRVCEGNRARVGVRPGMVEVNRTSVGPIIGFTV